MLIKRLLQSLGSNEDVPGRKQPALQHTYRGARTLETPSVDEREQTEQHECWNIQFSQMEWEAAQTYI